MVQWKLVPPSQNWHKWQLGTCISSFKLWRCWLSIENFGGVFVKCWCCWSKRNRGITERMYIFQNPLRKFSLNHQRCHVGVAVCFIKNHLLFLMLHLLPSSPNIDVSKNRGILPPKWMVKRTFLLEKVPLGKGNSSIFRWRLLIVSGSVPWFIRENPIKMDDLMGFFPYFWFNFQFL